MTYASGARQGFVVDAVELVDKPAVAINGTFTRDGEPVLRLVTCGGDFDYGGAPLQEQRGGDRPPDLTGGAPGWSYVAAVAGRKRSRVMPSSPWSNTGVDRRGRRARSSGADVDERGGHPHALVELDDGQQLGDLGGERRVRGLAGDGVAVHRAAPGHRVPVEGVGQARRAARPGVEDPRAQSRQRCSRISSAARPSQNGLVTSIGTGRGRSSAIGLTRPARSARSART